MKIRMFVLGLLILAGVIAVSTLLLLQGEESKKEEPGYIQELGAEIIVVAGREIRLTPPQKFVAQIGGEEQVIWIRRYDPPYDQNQPRLKSVEEADWSTPEASSFAEASANTVDWWRQAYTSESWARKDLAVVERQLKKRAAYDPGEAYFRFYFRVDFQRDGQQHALLFFGIQDEKIGGPLHQEGVMWYFGYVKEGDRWKRDSSLSAMSDWADLRKPNPLAAFIDEHLDELEQLSQAIKW